MKLVCHMFMAVMMFQQPAVLIIRVLSFVTCRVKPQNSGWLLHLFFIVVVL